jgi:hypothetical protein
MRFFQPVILEVHPKTKAGTKMTATVNADRSPTFPYQKSRRKKQEIEAKKSHLGAFMHSNRALCSFERGCRNHMTWFQNYEDLADIQYAVEKRDCSIEKMQKDEREFLSANGSTPARSRSGAKDCVSIPSSRRKSRPPFAGEKAITRTQASSLCSWRSPPWLRRCAPRTRT